MIEKPEHLLPVCVQTPIGQLKFYIDFAVGLCDCKLSLATIEPSLPLGMEVSACVAVLLQISTIDSVNELKFSCDWMGFDGEGGASSGEGLDAWEWRHNGYEVALGTEDTEALHRRWPTTAFAFDSYPIAMKQNKTTIQIGRLEAGNSYSLHYIVAWKPEGKPDDCSCWIAVDIPHSRILQTFDAAS